MSDLVNYNEQPRVLFIGGSGQLGIEVKSLKDKKNSFNFPSSSLLDLTNTQSISDCLDDKSPDIIINAGAYTNVDKAEEEKELCNKINNIGVELLAKEAIKRNIGIIHISTDYVFGKDSSGPFQAKNKTNPVNYYGKSKALGEAALINIHNKSMIIRMASLFSAYKSNFVKSIFHYLINKDEVRVIADQKISLTYAGDFSKNINEIIDFYYSIEKKEDSNDRIIHFVSPEYTNWFSVAKVIYNEIYLHDNKLIKADLIPIEMHEWNSKAVRAKDTRLKVDDYQLSSKNINLTNWEDAVRLVVRDLIKQI